ncbi:hypothetical protein CY35_13G063600 [Sphagnum magellanicum]|nr:hypothetical protein CY35_13G063600 [Sphagnum magellanicum]KAH9543418.1 hypothetical protein CY35_13G063600 [Sphagnum magellanicum]
MSGRSPPRHRHDGTSPLPLGMDASPAPSQWNGMHTKWPHDSCTGWSYCVFIPSWVVLPEAKAADGSFVNPIVFFRVQVGIQSPDGISALRGILRRFSDFLKLFTALKQSFPKKKLPAAPAKHSLMRMNSSTLLLERRYALEDWLGRLLADIVISRSASMASFLELEAAARFAVQSIGDGQAQASAPVVAGLPPTNNASLHLAPSPTSRLSWTGGGGSSVASGGLSNLEHGSDGTYADSGVGTLRKGSDNGLEIEMKALAIEEESAIIAAVSDRGENLLQDQRTRNGGGEEAGMDLHMQSSTQEEELVQSFEGRKPSSSALVTLHTEYESDSHSEFPAIERGNQADLAGISTGVSTPKSSTMAGMGHRKFELYHGRKASQDSIASEISSLPGSEISHGVLLDMPLEGSSLAQGSSESRREDWMGGVETDLLKGAGLMIPVDQRGKVRLLMVTLQRRLAVVKADMEDALARLKQETAVKEFLTAKVRDLEGEVDRMRRKGRDVLQEAVLTEREHVTSLQWEVEECRAALATAEETAQTCQDARIQAEQWQKDTKIKLEKAEKAMQEMEQQLEALQQARDAVDSQARTDKKLLAKEVRLLRHSQNELKMEAAHALEAKAALELSLQEEKYKQDGIRAVRSKFLYEMAMLRKRLQECSMEFLAKEDNIPASENGVSAGMINAFELLSTSDNHIDLLLAEAQLLAQEDDKEPGNALPSRRRSQPGGDEPHSNGETGRSQQQTTNLQASSLATESEAVLRSILIDMFIDQAQLQKVLNSVTRNALISAEKWRKDPIPTEASITKETLLN